MTACNGLIGIIAICIILVFNVQCSSGNGIEADLALINGKIVTMDDNFPEAEAVAVLNGKIIAVGSRGEIEDMIGDNTKVIDLGGKLVLPGFIDSHTHFVDGGFHLMGVDLKNARSQEEFGELLKAKSEELPPGAWITGGNWDHDKWPGSNLPSADLIDKYVPDRPVIVSRYDGHMSVANSMAMGMARITNRTPDPPGGIIVRIAGQEKPTGLLRDNAMGLVYNIIPPKSSEEIRIAIENALAETRKYGITSVHQVDLTKKQLGIYREIFAENKLTARMYFFIPISERDKISEYTIESGIGKEWLEIGGVKAFLDGSLGSTTAVFFDPYTQDPSTTGLYTTDPDDLKQQILESDKAGLQAAIHAIGDKANSVLLNIFDEVIKENGPRDRRFRIEHAQHIHPDDFKRFAELGVIASMQPYHAIDDGRFAEKRIGAERCKTTYAFKTFLDNNVITAFGSDWTVAPLNVIEGIYAAVTRRTLDDKNPDGWIPEQKISVEQAVKAYTLTAAYAQFQDDIKGSITTGKLADMILLSRDIFTIPPEQIRDVEVLRTIVGGKVVYDKTGSENN